MRCEVCGQDYGLTHNCPGSIPAISTADFTPSPPAGFALPYYFREATKIARWDEAAIRRASQDKRALSYGLAFWAVMPLLAFLQVKLAGQLEATWLGLIVGFVIFVLIFAPLTFLQYGLCHLIARGLFKGSGTFMGVIRPLFLGSIVQWLILIPYVGLFVGGIWALAILMVVFEEVEGIDRLKAFGIAFSVGLLFNAIGFYLMAPGQAPSPQP